MNKAPQGNCICGEPYGYGPCFCGAVPLANINDLLKSFDAREWARQFCFIAQELGYENKKGEPIDVGWMITWFASALMRGYDEYRWKTEKNETISDNNLDCGAVKKGEFVLFSANSNVGKSSVSDNNFYDDFGMIKPDRPWPRC